MLIVVDNYYKSENEGKADQIVEALKKCGRSQIKVVKYDSIDEETISSAEALILSGSAAHPWKKEHMAMYKNEISIVQNCEIPILGICFGHQLIGKAFDAEARKLPSTIKGFEKVEILQPDDIFSSWENGSILQLCQSHKDQISLPPNFLHLARSNSCENEAMKHPNRSIYSTQAHLERATEEHSAGFQVLHNFLAAI